MPKITYIEPDGTEKSFELAAGLSVMEGAINNQVKGIEADCGGACACSTCHVYVEAGEAGARSENEEDMLDFAFDVRPNSRLSCQIKLTAAQDGLRVRLPERQF